MPKIITTVSLISLIGVAYATAPIQSLKTNAANQVNAAASATAAQTTLTVAQQLTQQKNQIANLNTQVSGIADLKTTIKNLRGDEEEQTKALSNLKIQVGLLTQRVQALEVALPKKAHVQLPGDMKAKPVNGETASSSDYQAYNAAFKLIDQKEYKQAQLAFLAFIKKYPKTPYLSDAQYWSGELYLVSGQADKASQQFRAVISNKNALHRPDAMRQLGTIFLAKGDSAHAKEQFQDVIKDYPGTNAAKVAKQQLSKMK